MASDRLFWSMPEYDCCILIFLNKASALWNNSIRLNTAYESILQVKIRCGITNKNLSHVLLARGWGLCFITLYFHTFSYVSGLFKECFPPSKPLVAYCCSLAVSDRLTAVGLKTWLKYKCLMVESITCPAGCAQSYHPSLQTGRIYYAFMQWETTAASIKSITGSLNGKRLLVNIVIYY